MNIKKINKRGISAVVGTTIMVALVIGLTAIVWTVVTGVVEEELDSATSCFGNFDKITLNDRYTCNNLSENRSYFSISSKINVTEIIVSISGERSIKSFKINGFDSYDYVKNFTDADFGTVLTAPRENEGVTYVINTSHSEFKISEIDAIEIAPVIGGEQCDISDSILQIDDCRAFI